jgi:hypothetical protein
MGDGGVMSKYRCEASTYDADSRRNWPCQNKAKYHEDGKHYCGVHAPSRIEARRQKKRDRERAKRDKLHSDPEYLKGQISLCKARIEAHETELAKWERKLEAIQNECG